METKIINGKLCRKLDEYEPRQIGDCTVYGTEFDPEMDFPSYISAYNAIGIEASIFYREIPYGTESRVCGDIAERQKKGIAKYGITVQENPLTLKQWLTHAYEECLDQAVYLKRAIEEMEK